VTAQYAVLPAGPSKLGGLPATISLHSEVTASYCAPGHTAIFFEMSKESRPAALWKALDAVRDGFKCKR